ncbi:DUF742 domain-containing protein [Streptomyces sp. NPDC051940]|uniref:DUF742 domain-containing protein n=1 Tax=Streptomyces sp. NPDC051940 TaxID=3155675 RepID=UPI00344A0216
MAAAPQHKSDPYYYDDEAGPVVRPYAMARGRMERAEDAALSRPVEAVPGVRLPDTFAGEHAGILRLCRQDALTADELAGALDLPSAVVRVLVADLLDAGLVRARPADEAAPPVSDETLLRQVIEGLRAI